ncbi:MAG: type II 3-dehydroquinate dehydratase [Calditrichaeota bacterium]|nr:type II 3-dehydroquinate dehydratase [Calditrichota bacterium]
MAQEFLVIHGPNLNLLGEREPEIYGQMRLADLNREIKKYARARGVKISFFQSNHEGEIIDRIHSVRKKITGLIINPGALTHYSYALRDAIAGTQIPTVEVHLSDIHNREPFRKISVIKDVCLQQISGLGKESYFRGIDRIINEKSK